MRLKQLTEHVYYTESDSFSDRPTLGYILGRDFSVMVDAGNSPKHVLAYRQALEERGFAPPKFCVITHWHWDHTFGMSALEWETIACRETGRELQRMAAWEWSDQAMRKRLASGEEIDFADIHIRKEYDCLEEIQVAGAKILFEGEIVLICGGVTCRCIQTPSAHSEDSVLIFIPEEKVVFLGDIYNDDFYRQHYRDLEKTKQLKEALNDLDFTLAVPGHGEPIPKERLLAFLDGFLNEEEGTR